MGSSSRPSPESSIRRLEEDLRPLCFRGFVARSERALESLLSSGVGALERRGWVPVERISASSLERKLSRRCWSPGRSPETRESSLTRPPLLSQTSFCSLCGFNSAGQMNVRTGQSWCFGTRQHFCEQGVVCCGLDEPDGSHCAEERRSRAGSQVMEQLRGRGGNGSQKLCSRRELSGIIHSLVPSSFCIYVAAKRCHIWFWAVGVAG